MNRLVLLAAGVAILGAVLVFVLLVFGLPVGSSLALLVEGAFGDKFGWSRTAVKATPLLLASLGIVIAWRSAMYNIGGEGQLLVGATAGALAYKLVPLAPGLVLTPLVLIASAIAGSLFAAFAGWLHVRRGVQVVISTILLNFVAIQGISYAASGPLRESTGALPVSDRLPESVMLTRFDAQTDFHTGTLLAILLAGALFVYLFRTAHGFNLRLVGENPKAADAARIDGGRIRIQAMALSGALCGLAGGVEYAGVVGQISSGFSQNWGFLAIPAALIGGLHPLGVVASSGFVGALFAGSENLARLSAGGTTLIYVMQAMGVLGFVALQTLLKNRAVRGGL
ncbi:MAG: ABC transporter permease [Fimbriimonadaceae bacterium]|nr:hypothetical protein [Fimbriimonadaceae bacterium]MCC6351666.1 ABC transporter permease [Fimbriimonadaceae bacterium]